MSRVKRSLAWWLVVALSLAACAGSGPSTASRQAPPAIASSEPAQAISATAAPPAFEEPIRLVTLGDGYTYGTATSAPRRDSWPSQLVEVMERGGVHVILWNLAEQSHTSGLVVEEQLGQVASLEPDVVTLQVGVNDIFSRDTSFYRHNVETIFDELLTILPPQRIFAISMPDHTLTDWGLSFGHSEEGHAAVDELNRILSEAAAARGIGYIDISSVNDLAATDASLVIDEGPYGTPKQYAGWVELIGPRIHAVLPTIEP